MSKSILIAAYQPTVHRGVKRALECYLRRLCIESDKFRNTMFEDVFELACRTPEIKSLFNSVNDGGSELVTELLNNNCHDQCLAVYRKVSDANSFESIDNRSNYTWVDAEEDEGEQTES